MRPARGFTLIELVIVMALLGLLLSIALPRFMATLERGREQVLQHDLTTMRKAIDEFYGDRGRYPDRLDDLVTEGYLRAIPADPYTESATWVVVEPRDSSMGGVIDVRSTMLDAHGQRRDGPPTPPVGAPPLPGLVDGEGGGAQIVLAPPPGRTAQGPER